MGAFNLTWKQEVICHEVCDRRNHYFLDSGAEPLVLNENGVKQL